MALTKREFLKQAALAPVYFSLFNCNTAKRSTKNPNIVFIMADDLGYGHLGCYGQKIIQTPNIDKLASEGMRFTQAYAGCSVCAPSRCALITGTHTGHASVRGNGGGVSLLEEDVTIAQILRQAGYATGLFGKWGLGEAGTVGIPTKKGFDEFFGYLHQLHAQFYYPEFLWHNESKYLIPENVNMQRKVYAHDLIMGRAMDFVRHNHSQPFFLYLPVTIPHHEFIAPEETLKMYRGKFEEHPIDHWRDGYALPKEPKATFAAMVTHLDKGVGKLMALLNELQLTENTMVIFTSDNGGAHGPLESDEFFHANAPFRGYKTTLYEGGIRVPFIARWPKHIAAESISDQVTYFPDMMPTLAELGGASHLVPNGIDGLSIVPTLLNKGRQAQHEFLYWEDADYQRLPSYDIIPNTLMQAVRMGDWKAVRNHPDTDIELYNLKADEEEAHDLAVANPEIVEKMKKIMDSSHQPAPPQVDMTHKQAAKLYIPGWS